MGLRERQKISRRQCILDAALDLFVAKGFDATKSEEIAEKAEMALGTIYNHFSSKGEILLTLAAIENERLVDFGDRYIVAADGAVYEVFLGLFDGYYHPENLILNKDLWRISFALAFRDITSSGARRLRRSDKELTRQVVDLARLLRDREQIPQRVDPEVLGATLFNAVNMLFFEFTRSERMTEDLLLTGAQKTIHDILRLVMSEVQEDSEFKNG